MTSPLHLVCPHCDTRNRLPAARLAESPNCGRCKQALFGGSPLALDTHSLPRHLTASDLPLLVDFWAPWCGPCQAMAPQFAAAAGHLEPRVRLAKIDTEAHPELGRQYGIRSIPTLIVFQGGREIARHSGAMGLRDILDWTRGALGDPLRSTR